MSIALSEKDLALWQGFCNVFYGVEHPDAMPNIRRDADNLLNIFRYAFLSAANQGAAYQLAKMLKQEEVKLVFDEVLYQITVQTKGYPLFMNLVESLPQEWLKDNFEAYLDPLLKRLADENIEDLQTYNSLFAVIFKIDRGMTIRLAKRAILLEADPEIQELGQGWLEDLGANEE